jgi:hypothetical protein
MLFPTGLSFSDSVSLKKDDQAMLILRHECRLPPASASFIQKVGQSVFIFPRMARELDYDGLVFFHAGGEMKIC